jgi:hypothetical protein
MPLQLGGCQSGDNFRGFLECHLATVRINVTSGKEIAPDADPRKDGWGRLTKATTAALLGRMFLVTRVNARWNPGA